jgi:hypothetical protein
MITDWRRKNRKIDGVGSLLLTLLITAFCLLPLLVLITSIKQWGRST